MFSSTNITMLVKEIGELLTVNNQTLCVAESCTAGGISAAITSNAGSSKYFQGGIIAYADKINEEISKMHTESKINIEIQNYDRHIAEIKNIYNMKKYSYNNVFV